MWITRAGMQKQLQHGGNQEDHWGVTEATGAKYDDDGVCCVVMQLKWILRFENTWH